MVFPKSEAQEKSDKELALALDGFADDLKDHLKIAATGVTLTMASTYGPKLLAKMRNEISRIMDKTAGPNGVQYALRVTTSGTYPCFSCSSGEISLKAGDVWKFGETTKPSSRYSATWLRQNKLRH